MHKVQHGPGNLVTTRHGEQPFALKDPVPRLDGVTGAHGYGPFTGLDFSPQLSSGLSVRVSVPLILRIWRRTLWEWNGKHQIRWKQQGKPFSLIQSFPHLPLQLREARRCGHLHRGRCWCRDGTGHFPSICIQFCCHTWQRWISDVHLHCY